MNSPTLAKTMQSSSGYFREGDSLRLLEECDRRLRMVAEPLPKLPGKPWEWAKIGERGCQKDVVMGRTAIAAAPSEAIATCVASNWSLYCAWKEAAGLDGFRPYAALTPRELLSKAMAA